MRLEFFSTMAYVSEGSESLYWPNIVLISPPRNGSLIRSKNIELNYSFEFIELNVTQFNSVQFNCHVTFWICLGSRVVPTFKRARVTGPSCSSRYCATVARNIGANKSNQYGKRCKTASSVQKIELNYSFEFIELNVIQFNSIQFNCHVTFWICSIFNSIRLKVFFSTTVNGHHHIWCLLY